MNFFDVSNELTWRGVRHKMNEREIFTKLDYIYVDQIPKNI